MKNFSGFFHIIFLFLLVFLASLFSPVNAISSFIKSSSSSVLSPDSSSWEGSRIWQPAVVQDGNEFKMWYAGYNGRFQIGLAHSSDGINWAKDSNNPVVSRLSLDNRDSHDPTVLFNGTSYEMWYTSSTGGGATDFAIQRATSNNGISWTNNPVTRVFQPSSGWGAGTATAPFVIKIGLQYKMWYTSNDGRWKIGYATSPDGITWTQYSGNPVLYPTESWEGTDVADATVILNGTTYEIFYNNASGIAHATSTDGINWTNKTLLLGPTGGTFDAGGIYASSALRLLNGTTLLYYGGRDAGNTWRIGSAADGPISSPPTNKVVVLPGFGASWNADAILNCKTEGYSPEEWELVPIWGAPVYNPIMTALQNAGMTPELFLYDWRRAVASTAGLLKPFIENGLVTGEKKYLVGHSMGGLVGRAYLDQVTTDHQLDKMITVGTPHKGAPKAYPAWSAGQIWEDDLFKRIAFTTILKSCGLRNGQDDRETTQTMIPSVRDLLPIFNYLRDNTTGLFKSVGLMSAQNTWLTGSAFSAPFHGVTMGTLYGNTFETLSGMAVKNRNRHDERLSNWADGKPLEKEFSPNGDGTVLEMSSVLAGADNRTIALNHENLIASTGGILKIFDFLGITPVDLSASSFVEPASALVVIGYPANVWITDPTGKTFKDTQGLVIIANPKPGTYKLKLVPKSLGNIRIIVAQFLEDGRTFWKEYPYRSMLPKFGAINFDPANPQEDALR